MRLLSGVTSLSGTPAPLTLPPQCYSVRPYCGETGLLSEFGYLIRAIAKCYVCRARVSLAALILFAFYSPSSSPALVSGAAQGIAEASGLDSVAAPSMAHRSGLLHLPAGFIAVTGLIHIAFVWTHFVQLGYPPLSKRTEWISDHERTLSNEGRGPGLNRDSLEPVSSVAHSSA